MDALGVLLAVAIVVFCGVYFAKFWACREKLHQTINKLPGPPTYPLVGTTLHFFGLKPREMLKVAKEMSQKYGPIYRIWLGTKPEIVIEKPQQFEAIINGTTHLQKAGMYRFLKPWLGTGLITNSGARWHVHRKMITPAFHLTVLDSFIEVFSEKCDIMMDKLQQKANGAGFDIYPFITLCALDIICEAAMGTSVHAQEDIGAEYVKRVSELTELTVLRREKLWLHPDFIFYNTPTGRRYKNCLDVLQGFTKNVIQERNAALSNAMNLNGEPLDEDPSSGIRKKKVFLDLLIKASEKQGKMTDEELREEVDTFMFAGHDTTATSTAWTLFMLGHHPEIQEKVYKEISEIFQGSQKSPTMKDLEKMKYLDRVIKEVLRVYPTIPFIQRLLSEDLRIDGYDIPAGTTVIINLYLANRDVDNFPNPEVFDPDNFLPERIEKRHHFAFIPFSAGPRNCIGQKFALLEEKTIVSSILRKYKIRSLEKIEEVTPVPTIVLRPEHGIKVSITPRT